MRRREERPRTLLRGVIRILSSVLLVPVLAFVVALKVWFVTDIGASPVLVGYGTLVGIYLGTRLLLAALYRPQSTVAFDDDRLPVIRVVIPVMNEAGGIEPTVRSVLASAYPTERLTVHVIDDGSTDDTWDVLERNFAGHAHVVLTRFPNNHGKRAGMACGIRAADEAQVIVFVDSDSLLSADALRSVVTPICTEARRGKVGGVTGHAEVSNVTDGTLARMQQVRYWAAFRIVKAAESGSGTITCASGCFSAWRRELLLSVIDRWEAQSFLGTQATFGDDRALTNFALRDGWDVVYQSTARCSTEVPATLRRFCTQQMRWKRSWTRESVHLMRFVWRRGPYAALPAYASVLFQLAGPLVVAWCVVLRPLTQGANPLVYIVGLYAMALIYALVYAAARGEREWSAGILFTLLYTGVLVWQTYFAMATCRRTGWGTRSVASPALDTDRIMLDETATRPMVMTRAT
jgi:hyaluronan synthase